MQPTQWLSREARRRAVRLAGALVVLVPLLLFFVVPLLDVLWRSITPDGTLTFGHALTFANYRSVLGSEVGRIILRNTFVVALEACVATAVLGYPVAMYLIQIPRRRALVIVGLLLLPSLSSFVVSLYGMSLLLQPLGLLYTHWGSVIGMIEYLLPYMILMLYGTMAGIDAELVTSARSLGATWFQAFTRVFLPLTRAGLLSSSLIVFIIGLAFFLTPAVLGGPSDITAALYIEQEIRNYDWAGASAMGVTLLIVTSVLYSLAARLGGLNSLSGQAVGGQRGASSSESRWPGPVMWTLRSVTVVCVLFVFAPLIALIPASLNTSSYLSLNPSGLTLHWYATALDDPGWGAAIWLSVRIAVLTAICATLLGLAGAFTLVRVARRSKPVLRLLFTGPLIVPVILYAIAIFDLESRLKVTGSLLGYVIAHTTMALPFTVTILAQALDNLGSEYEDAAGTLGASPARAVWAVTTRLLSPALASAAALAFVMSWGEAVVALILSGVQSTLPVRIYDFMQVELTPETAALGTMVTVAILALAAIGYLAWSARSRASHRPSWRPPDPGLAEATSTEGVVHAELARTGEK